MRVMVFINKFVEFLGEKCVLCSEGFYMKEDVKIIGFRVEIIWKCKNGYC